MRQRYLPILGAGESSRFVGAFMPGSSRKPSPSEYLPLATHVGTTAQRAELGIDSHSHAGCTDVVTANQVDDMAATPQCPEHIGTEAGFDVYPARRVALVAEGLVEVRCLEARRLERLLD